MLLLLIFAYLISPSIENVTTNINSSVNTCVLRCKDNHMREMDNEWTSDFTLPLLSLLRTTGNESAALSKLKGICESNLQLDTCLSNCNKSQEVSILRAGTKSWQDACENIDEVRAQFTCWKSHGNDLQQSCGTHTLRLKASMMQFAMNQTIGHLTTICSDYDRFAQCMISEHGRSCGMRSELITGRMFQSNREAMFSMLKLRWSSLPSQCGYQPPRRDTTSREHLNQAPSNFGPWLTMIFCIWYLYI